MACVPFSFVLLLSRDRLLFERWCDEFQQQYHVDPRENGMASRELQTWAERSKIALESTDIARVHIPLFMRNPSCGGGRAVNRDRPGSGPSIFAGEFSITRAEYHELCSPLHARCEALLQKAMTQACTQAGDINTVVLVGAMTADPSIRELLQVHLCAPFCRT